MREEPPAANQSTEVCRMVISLSGLLSTSQSSSSSTSSPSEGHSQPPLHAEKGEVRGPSQDPDEHRGAEDHRSVLPRHFERHGKHGGDQDVVDVSEHPPEGRPLNHPLVVRLQIDPSPLAPEPLGQTQELEAVQGDGQRHVGHAEEVSAQPGGTAFLWEGRRQRRERTFNMLLEDMWTGGRCLLSEEEGHLFWGKYYRQLSYSGLVCFALDEGKEKLDQPH